MIAYSCLGGSIRTAEGSHRGLHNIQVVGSIGVICSVGENGTARPPCWWLGGARAWIPIIVPYNPLPRTFNPPPS